MKWPIPVVTAALAMIATDASAQINLSGKFQCVQLCRPEFQNAPAYVTQNGYQMNLSDEGGGSSRAWIDWPGHIWIEGWGEGAIYSPDGETIQFDRGRVWQRWVEPPPAPVVVTRTVTRYVTRPVKHRKRPVQQ